MLTYARWKYFVIVIVFALSVLYALPNVFPQDPSVQVTSSRGAPVDAALTARVTAELQKIGFTRPKVAIESPNNLLVRLDSPESQVKAADAVRAALGSDYVVALNLASNSPAWLDAVRAQPMRKGLDLQGGVHFLMQVDQKAAYDKRFDAIVEDMRVTLRDARIGYSSIERVGTDRVVARLNNAADLTKARDLVSRGQTALQYQAEGSDITVQVPEAELRRMAVEAVDQNVSTLRNRINALGVAEPIIQRQGEDRIVVQLPGVQDTAQAKRVLGATATLEFHGVHEGNMQAALDGNVPGDARIYNRKERGPDGKPLPVLLKKAIIVSGDQLVGATSGRAPSDGSPSVSIKLNAAGGERMFDYSSEHVNKGLAVVYTERIPEVAMVDGQEVRTTRISEEVISVANINEPLGRDFITSGLDSSAQATELALLLKSGALAAPMDFIDERTVGPSLGAENVARGTKAIGWSLAFAFAFFLVYYRMFGVITCLALGLNLLMVVAVMSLFGATLTLPGLAGIALTVGMSVDANVLINERIREELRAGLPPQTAIVTGYEKAAGTIVDANLTAIIAGIALFSFGDGPVKGFALSLIVGILTSMYTAVGVSRALATLIYGGRRKIKSISI